MRLSSDSRAGVSRRREQASYVNAFAMLEGLSLAMPTRPVRAPMSLRSGILIVTFSVIAFAAGGGAKPLRAQAGGAWQVAVGVGAAKADHRLQGAAAVAGELDRRLLGTDAIGMSATATGAYFLKQTDFVCATTFAATCDLRVFAALVAVTLAADVQYLRAPLQPYVRAGVGRWWGRDSGAAERQASSENGLLLTMEVGVHASRRFTVGLEQKRIEGTRFGMVPLMDLVGRLSF